MHAHTRVQRNVFSVLGKEARWFGSCSMSKSTQAERLPHLESENCCDWTKMRSGRGQGTTLRWCPTDRKGEDVGQPNKEV